MSNPTFKCRLRLFAFLVFSQSISFPGASQSDTSEYEHLFLNTRDRTGGFEVSRNIQDRPNIFMITVDMVSPDVYLPTRELSRHIKTPNLDALKSAGTQFTRTYSTSPLCGPSRASILTGRHQPYLTNGERAPMGMVRSLDNEDLIFPQYLKRVGYDVNHVGKWHVGAEKFVQTFGENQHGWDRWAPPLSDDHQYVGYLRDLNIKPQKYAKEIWGKQYDRKSQGNSLGGWIEQSDGKPFPVEGHYSVFLAELAKQKIDVLLDSSRKKPLFLQLEFFDPHQPYSIPSGFEKRYEELKRVVAVPESFKRLVKSNFSPPEDEPDIYQVYRRYWGFYDEEGLKDYIIGHLLQMEVVDYAIGRFFAYLKEKDLWDNSVISFSADHGDMNGRIGMADKGVYFQPDIFRIPLIIKLPSSENVNRRIYDGPASCLDIAPTILSYAGIRPPAFMEGEDLSNVMRGDDRPPLHHVFQTGWHVGVNYGFGYQYIIDGTHWFYGYNISSGIQELYDIDADDQINRFYSPENEQLRKEIILRSADVLRSDNRWLGYWATFRLHNAEYLPIADDDMQMFRPKERN